jgi:hypothetical protein
MSAAAAGVAAALTDASWQPRAAVFHVVPLPRAAALLSDIASMHARESDTKRSLVGALRRLVAELSADGGGGGGGGSSGGSSGDVEALRERLTAAIAAWLARPFVDDERVDLILGTLTEDMNGF